MQDIIDIFLLLIGLYFVILFHECGHFIISKIVKFTCEEFQMGIGPKIFSKEHKGTKYCFKLIPLGGICTFTEFIQEHSSTKNVRGFYLRKIAVLLGGPVMNFILAFLLMLCAFGNTEGLKVKTINDNELAETTIVQGDIIRNINDERVFNIDDIEELLVVNAKNTVTFLNSEYEKETISFYCTNSMLDIEFDNSFENKINGSIRTFNQYIKLITESVNELFSGESSVASETIEMTNPYDSMNSELEVPQSFFRSINKFMMVTSIVSFCLGVFNLLPIVVFDGFKVLVSLISVIINRDIPQKANIIIAIAGVALSILIIF